MSAPPPTVCRDHVTVPGPVIPLHLNSGRKSGRNPFHVLVDAKACVGEVDFETALPTAAGACGEAISGRTKLDRLSASFDRRKGVIIRDDLHFLYIQPYFAESCYPRFRVQPVGRLDIAAITREDGRRRQPVFVNDRKIVLLATWQREVFLRVECVHAVTVDSNGYLAICVKLQRIFSIGFAQLLRENGFATGSSC